MKKSFSNGKQNRSSRNSRGVAIVFTLGILGLLTVIALGFASTALLNRKIADNTGDMIYARHIAKNIALAHASYSVERGFSAAKVYSQEISGDPAETDFLWKMDTLLDGVKLYWSTGDADTAYRSDGARWQYLYEPDNNPVSGKKRILGRYAYAAVSFSGRMDPMVNLGGEASRYGSTEKELKLPNNGYDWNANLKDKLALPNRWASPVEIFKALGITDAATKRNFLNSGIGFDLQAAPEVYWVDKNKDGKKTDDELYLRCNFPYYNASDAKTFWQDMTVDKLIGASEADKTLEEAKASGDKSISFIPWLKRMAENGKETQAKQIAANILQYNRPGPNALDSDGKPVKTVSDKMGTDWLTDKPTYAGVGRHPMLNEIGFRVIIQAKVDTEEVKDDAGNITDYKYTPKYLITVESGAELVCPFFGSDFSEASVKFPETGHLEIQLCDFKKQNDISHITSLSDIVVADTSPSLALKTNEAQLEKYNWNKVDLNLDSNGTDSFYFAQTDWNASPAYTKASKFWKSQTEQTVYYSFDDSNTHSFTLPNNKTTDQSAEILKQMKIQHINFKPGYAVMYYGPDQAVERQRDFAVLNDEATDKEQYVGEKKWVFFISYEAKDPLVNHSADDWKITKSDAEYPTTGTAADELDKLYPGTIVDSSGTEKHVNSTISGKLLTETLSDGTAVDLEMAEDPAFTAGTRLSTSYIRHEPMRSLWELGCISRGEAWKTLNLAKRKIFDATDATLLIPGTFEEGDANILDQIKFSDTDESLYVYGKANINAQYHKALEQVFKTDVTWKKDLTAGEAEEPFGTTGNSSFGDSLVCADADGRCLEPCSDPGSCSKSCLAHLLMERSRILPFGNRTDILMDPADANFEKIPGYSALSSTEQNNLKHIQENLRNLLLKPQADSTDIKLEREQYAVRFMNLLNAGAGGPEDHVYIIVVAQVIRDVGGAPQMVDWNKNGEFDSGTVNITPEAKYLSTGYVRKKLDNSGYELIGAPGSFTELSNTLSEIGKYEPGVDKITGETKLIVEMVRDQKTMKWRMTRFRYVE